MTNETGQPKTGSRTGLETNGGSPGCSGHRLRRRSFLGVAAGTLAGIAGCADGDDPRSGGGGLPRLHVDGRWLRDPGGNPVVLRGVGVVDPVWATEHADERGKAYAETVELATDESAGWHPSVLRIPILPSSIDAEGLDHVLEEYVDPAVELAAERGVYALVTYQAVERYDTPSIDRRIRSFWNDVAPRYADDSHVLYELFAAPSEPASGGIEAWRTWKDHAGPWVSNVRADAPDTPIVVGSPAWSSMTAYAAEEPFEQDGLLYSAHVYPSWDPSSWEATFGTPALDVPVFVTEWGYTGTGADREHHLLGTTEEWGEPFREWVDAHANVHWAATTFDSQREPAVFADDWTPTDGEHGMGSLLQEWLADRQTDHRPGTATPIPTGDGPAPAPPSGVSLGAIGDDRATIQWEAPSTTDAPDVLQYRVTVDDRDPAILRGSVRSASVDGLDPGQDYEARVVAVDERGVASEPAPVAFTTNEPQAPLATISRTSAVPEVVDGGWEDVDRHSVDQFLWGEQIQGVCQWQAVWDEEALYVLAALFEPDGVEQRTTFDFFLDLDDSSRSSYDGQNDLQLIVNRGAESAVSGANSAPVVDGVEVETGTLENGWWSQVSVPWTAYGVRPIAGHRIGLDTHLVPIDETGGRVGEQSWVEESYDAWENPSAFGTVELGP